MPNLKARTRYCGEYRINHAGESVTACGWVQKARDLGPLLFVDLRDRSGIVQLCFDDNTPRDVLEKARTLRSEYVLRAVGTVRERSAKNKDIPTGAVEIAVTALEILGKSETPPFEIAENCKTDELIRLKYRYLDLRRPDLQKNILLRHRIAKITRDYFDENGFIEIETPMLIRSTPEGARDYIVPSRIHKGSVYALPQSPQLYKQLCMVAGFDRYIQLARCFRDEDLRADRQPEFTQIDLEMSFAELEDVLAMVEGFLMRLDRELHLGLTFPIPRMAYREAIARFGSDKPDTRYGLELFDAKLELFGNPAYGFTATGGYATYTRKEIDKLTEEAKGIGAKGLAYVRIAPDGTVQSSLTKLLGEEGLATLIQTAAAKPGDAVFLVADPKYSLSHSILGALRQSAARKLGIVPKEGLKFLWVVDFPFFDFDEDAQEWVAMHHPFTAPTEESLAILETDKANAVAKAADLTLNGIEMSSGSVRITDPELQGRIFNLLGLGEEEIRAKFGFLVEAFRYGPPPHAGMGLGLDRLVMQILGCESLRDVTAFPKVQNASEPMTQCPAPADPVQLADLGLTRKGGN
ncbi:MAG: aspartate--tRNA ligase [Oscillospiraceae bacterium]|jgi:aspartyl-tRNA synthetase|nr:aspartate--tRNA ligase [Oscillospiraceae bacterium]